MCGQWPTLKHSMSGTLYVSDHYQVYKTGNDLEVILFLFYQQSVFFFKGEFFPLLLIPRFHHQKLKNEKKKLRTMRKNPHKTMKDIWYAFDMHLKVKVVKVYILEIP